MANQTRSRLMKPLAVGAMVLGLTAGSYGVAAAASDASSSQSATDTAAAASTTTPSTTTQSQDDSSRPAAPPGATDENPWGNQRSDETLLTGDTATKVTEAALAEAGDDATVVRVETDADGNASYEAHIVKADGTPVTVYVDESFNVVSTDSR